MLPKTLFLTTVKDADKFKDLTRSDGFQAALLFAQAETIERNPMNEERLEGIRAFVKTLLDLGEPDSKLEPLPDKSLKHHALDQRKPKV